MRRFSNAFLIVVTATALLVLPGCGDDPKGYEFKSLKKPATGDVVKIAYDIAAGDGIRMKMTMRGTMEATGDASMSTPMNSDMEMSLRCTEVRKNGDKVFEMAVDKMDVSAAGQTFGKEMLGELRGTMVIDANGKMKDMDISGGETGVGEELNKVFKSPGFQSFVPMPPEGMRIGEALDLAKIMPAEAMGQLMNASLPGSSIKPELNGELVLMGTRQVDGEEVAEFAINLVMNMAGSMSQAGQTIDMDMGVKVSGTQYTSLKSGFPLGTSEMKMDMRGEVEGNGEQVEMTMSMTMTIECTKL